MVVGLRLAGGTDVVVKARADARTGRGVRHAAALQAQAAERLRPATPSTSAPAMGSRHAVTKRVAGSAAMQAS